MISRSTIDRVFETARVEEVIGEFVQLKKAGSNFKGLSPFVPQNFGAARQQQIPNMAMLLVYWLATFSIQGHFKCLLMLAT